MPELPEVETTLRGIEPHIINKTIKSVIIRQPSLRWPVPKSLIKRKLEKKKIESIKRRGKYLLLESSNENLIIHLGMSGSLRIAREDNLKKHDHIDICFEDGTILRYCDPRRFGCFLWSKDIDTHFLLKNLGPEPLGNSFSGDYLFYKSRKRKVPIKNFIMNSKVVLELETSMQARLYSQPELGLHAWQVRCQGKNMIYSPKKLYIFLENQLRKEELHCVTLLVEIVNQAISNKV